MTKEQKIRKEDSANKWEKYTLSKLISEKYPNVIEITLNLKLDYPNAFSVHKKDYTRILKPTERACFEIDCINRDCLFSDLTLDSEVHKAISQKLEFYKGYRICNGYDTFSSYEHRNGTCLTRLDYEIRIKYNT